MNAQEVSPVKLVGWMVYCQSNTPQSLGTSVKLAHYTEAIFEVKTRLENGSPRFELLRGLFDETWEGGEL